MVVGRVVVVLRLVVTLFVVVERLVVVGVELVEVLLAASCEQLSGSCLVAVRGDCVGASGCEIS